MALRDQLAEHPRLLEAVLAVATCRDSLDFIDLHWPPFDREAHIQRLLARRDPGVVFATRSRMVAIEEHGGELRYYAGGVESGESFGYQEVERMVAEGEEMGVFRTPRDAILFSERYLAGKQALQHIEAAREVLSRRETTI